MKNWVEERTMLGLKSAMCLALFWLANPGGELFAQSVAGSTAQDQSEPSTKFLSDKNYPDVTIRKIAFGSCNKPKKDQRFWDVIRDKRPDLMLLLGDNHYAESVDPKVLRKAYDGLAAVQGYMALRRQVPTFSTWDNHDYGARYPGKLHPHADASEQLFLNHFKVPDQDARRHRTGIYGAWVFGEAPRRVQVILLDLERNRDPYPASKEVHRFPVPHTDRTKSLLGAEQWKWLETQLQNKAEVRLIGSGIQVLSNEHTWRRWGMFPHERERLLQLIDATSGTTMLLSGDRHRGELSIMNPKSNRPLLDMTASSFNLCYPGRESNSLREGNLIEMPHFGWIEINWKENDMQLQLLSSEDAAPLLSHRTEFWQ